LDQLARDGDRQLLAGLRLPDHEAATRILPGPARVTLTVLDYVAAADRAWAKVRPRNANVLELGVQLPHGRLGELDDVAHERLARIFAGLDLREPVLPVARQARGREGVLAQQPDYVEPLLCHHQSPTVALDVA